NEGLEVAHASAETASHAKTAFLERLDHDVRSPVSAMLGVCELLEGTRLTPEQSGHIDIVRQSARVVVAHMNDLLAFSDAPAFAGQPFAPGAPVDAACATWSREAERKALELSVQIPDGLAESVIADCDRLARALDKLVANAITYCESGTVRVGVRADDSLDEARLVYFVSDTGPGIAPDTLDRLLRGEAVDDKKLGVSICQRLVAQLGGRLQASSVEGSGSTFWFSIPYATVDNDVVRAPEIVAGPSPLSGKRLLVVDDDETSRRVTCYRLNSVGAKTVTAADAKAALSAVRAQSFDALVLDMHMPGANGLKVAEMLRAEPNGVELPVVVLSSRLTSSHRRSAAELGIGHLLRRPVSIDRLVAAVRATLRPEAAPTHSSGRRVLVVDDNPTNRRLAARMLERRGYEIELACDGREALEAHTSRPFDAILMDCRMPIMDGVAATVAIRAASGVAAKTPIIAVTASPHPGDRQRCLDAGMNSYLLKPVDFDEVDRLLCRATASLPPAAETVAPEPAPTYASVVSFDPAALEQYIDSEDDRAFVIELIDDFRVRGDQDVSTISAAAARGDAAALRELAHNLKSVSATVGAARVSAISRVIEINAAEQDLVRIETLVDDLQLAWVESSAAIAAHKETLSAPEAVGSRIA
ncbi:MAG: two-component system sensor histidine kinase/response regulator, partial [Myxococcota bacterium]